MSQLEQKYPESMRLQSVRGTSQAIGEFLTWLSDQGIHLAKFDDRGIQLEQHYEPLQNLLARFFEIDLNKVEQERQQILDELAKGQQA